MLGQIILDVLLALILVLVIVFLILRKFTRYNLFHNFALDDLLLTKEADSLPGKNLVFATSKSLSPYVKKYVLSKNGNERLLILNYSKPIKEIAYYVLCYSAKNKLIDVIEVNEKDTTTTSKIIGLTSNIENVNIVLKSVDKVVINSQIVKPMTRRSIRLYSFLVSFVVFASLFLLKDLIFLAIFKQYRYGFAGSIHNLIIVLTILVVSIITFISLLISLKKRNIKMRSGGILEYEFF